MFGTTDARVPEKRMQRMRAMIKKTMLWVCGACLYAGVVWPAATDVAEKPSLPPLAPWWLCNIVIEVSLLLAATNPRSDCKKIRPLVPTHCVCCLKVTSLSAHGP